MLLRAAVLLVVTVAALADEVELNNGAGFSGKIVAEDESSVTIRLEQGGTMTFDKLRVAKIRRGEVEQGRASSGEGAKTGEFPLGHGKRGPEVASPSSAVEQGPLEDLVARVGPGGVTRKEFEVYLRIWARDHGKEAETVEERRQALEPAIVDELLFQAALESGVLRDEYVRWSVRSVYTSLETTAKVDPREFTEEELRAFYEAHPEEFTEPAAVRLEGARIDSEEQEAVILEALRRGETPPGGFTDQGWLEPGTEGPISEGDCAALLALQVGEVSAVIEVFGGMRIAYRCVERREPRRKSFDECRGRVKFLLLSERVRDKGEEVGARLETEEGTFQEALRKGVHRRPECRPGIINLYLEQTKQKREEAAAALRERIPVEILLKD